MTLRDYIVILRQGWIAIIVCSVLGAMTGWGLAAMQPREYTATSELYVSIADDGELSSIFQMGEYMRSQMVTYSELADTPVVLDSAREKMDQPVSNEELSQMVSVTIPSESYVIEVNANASDPKLSADAAQAVADSLSEAVADLAPEYDNRSVVTLRSIRQAETPQDPAQVPWTLWAGAGLVIGAIIGLLLAFVKHALRQDRPANHTRDA
ncbi:MAG: Wzz/FepE/Etk N-terminal domain-containing protein [Kocuria sp.]|nr:Wzz/FepE/Etk N-terminal domain-containing protein [Kocuria sp.]